MENLSKSWKKNLRESGFKPGRILRDFVTEYAYVTI